MNKIYLSQLGSMRAFRQVLQSFFGREEKIIASYILFIGIQTLCRKGEMLSMASGLAACPQQGVDQNTVPGLHADLKEEISVPLSASTSLCRESARHDLPYVTAMVASHSHKRAAWPLRASPAFPRLFCCCCQALLTY
jgi:hypothetical protein